MVTLLRAEMPYTLTVTELPVISDDFANALGQLLATPSQYIPEAQKKQYQDDSAETPMQNGFTVEDLRFILSLLASILILALCPCFRMNSSAILKSENAQHAEMIEPQQENTELIETSRVTDAIQSLTEQPDAIRREQADPDHA